MAEGTLELPPDSTGQKLRVETGDYSNNIPTGVIEEVIIPSDASGNLPGDKRQRSLAVSDSTLDDVLAELKKISLVLQLGLNIDLGE